MTGKPDETMLDRRRRRQQAEMDDRALSDLIGFVLTFSVILASVALVSTFGLDALDDIQQNEQVNNAERAFTVMAENFNELERGNAPERTSEIDLNQGQLSVVDDSEFTVTVIGSAATAPPSGSDAEFVIETDALRFSRSEATLVYENGATFRSTGPSGGSVFEDKPNLACTEDKAILSFVELRTDTDRQLGSGTVRITGRQQASRILYPTSREDAGRDGTGVSVEVDSPRANGWRTYFIGDQENWEQGASDDVYECTGIDEILVKKTVIDVTFTR